MSSCQGGGPLSKDAMAVKRPRDLNDNDGAGPALGLIGIQQRGQIGRGLVFDRLQLHGDGRPDHGGEGDHRPDAGVEVAFGKLQPDSGVRQ